MFMTASDISLHSEKIAQIEEASLEMDEYAVPSLKLYDSIALLSFYHVGSFFFPAIF